MTHFHKLATGTQFHYNGYLWTKLEGNLAQLHGGSKYPFPAEALIRL